MPNNKFELRLTLKQHTPIIHFQHDQKGATLRGTELKPKLDKFLFEKIDDVKVSWLIGKGDKKAFDYKVRIIPIGKSWKDYIEKPKEKNGGLKQKWNKKEERYSTETFPYPLYFGNLGEDYYKEDTIKKFGFYEDSISVSILCFHSKLLELIKNYFPEFLAINNFGSRQGKGFGSFYLEGLSNKPINENWFDYKTSIKIDRKIRITDKTNLFKNLFDQLDWFYRCFRGGINKKKPRKENGRMIKDENGLFIFDDVFYFKSLLFFYFKEKKVQWEKKTIKSEFFYKDKKDFGGYVKSYGAKTQTESRNSDILKFESPDKKLTKTLLGLSSQESWKSYNSSIEKKEVLKINDKKFKEPDDKDIIQRFKSPIFFKILRRSEDIYDIYIKFEKSILIAGKWFSIVDTKSKKTIYLQVPDEFSFLDFFEFVSDPEKFTIEKYVEKEFQDEAEYFALKNIFGNLQKTSK